MRVLESLVEHLGRPNPWGHLVYVNEREERLLSRTEGWLISLIEVEVGVSEEINSF